MTCKLYFTTTEPRNGEHEESHPVTLWPLKVVSATIGRNINYYIHLIFPHDNGCCGVFHPVKTILNAAQNPTTPAPCLWLVGSMFIVVGSTISYCVWSRSTGCVQRRVVLTSCLRGGQLADQEERSDERDHLYFGRESLIQPLKQAQCHIKN